MFRLTTFARVVRSTVSSVYKLAPQQENIKNHVFRYLKQTNKIHLECSCCIEKVSISYESLGTLMRLIKKVSSVLKGQYGLNETCNISELKATMIHYAVHPINMPLIRFVRNAFDNVVAIDARTSGAACALSCIMHMYREREPNDSISNAHWNLFYSRFRRFVSADFSAFRHSIYKLNSIKLHLYHL